MGATYVPSSIIACLSRKEEDETPIAPPDVTILARVRVARRAKMDRQGTQRGMENRRASQPAGRGD